MKPENILIGTDDTPKLADLGLAKAGAAAEDGSLTQSGTTVGTPHYIAPEQARGEKDIDGRADIYALGCTLYHAATGRTPFEAGATAVLMRRLRYDMRPIAVLLGLNLVITFVVPGNDDAGRAMRHDEGAGHCPLGEPDRPKHTDLPASLAHGAHHDHPDARDADHEAEPPGVELVGGHDREEGPHQHHSLEADVHDARTLGEHPAERGEREHSIGIH